MYYKYRDKCKKCVEFITISDGGGMSIYYKICIKCGSEK